MYSILSIDVITEVDVLIEILEELPISGVLDVVRPQDDISLGHVKDQRTVLRVKGIPLVVKLADKFTSELLLLGHLILLPREEEGVLSLPHAVVFVPELLVRDNRKKFLLLCPLTFVFVLH